MKDYSQVLDLLELSPNVKLLDVTSNSDDFSEILAKELIDFEGHLDIAMYPGEHNVPEYDFVKAHTSKDYKSPFRALPRDYSSVFVRDILDKHTYNERILKIAYTSLLNASEIIVMQDKSTMPQVEIENVLEKLDFRAVNTIDIFEDTFVVVAKKMHMWGNGL